MGEYYDWVNVDKRQYLKPGDFGHGSKRFESWWYRDAILGAVHSLLATEWKGDHIVFIGDYADRAEYVENETINRIRKQMHDIHYEYDIYSFYLDHYINVSGWFKDAEAEVREEIGNILEDSSIHNWYGIDPARPYRGLFQREGQFFRYVINESRREYYDTEYTTVQDGKYKIDPLPFLLSCGEKASYDKYAGIWLGDIISVSNREPYWYRDITDSNIWEPEINRE